LSDPQLISLMRFSAVKTIYSANTMRFADAAVMAAPTVGLVAAPVHRY
jgi:hypothetical protein